MTKTTERELLHDGLEVLVPLDVSVVIPARNAQDILGCVVHGRLGMDGRYRDTWLHSVDPSN